LKIPGFNFNVTFDSVVNAKKKVEIQEEVQRLAGGTEDSKKWLPYYQTAKKTVKESLSDDEKASFEEDVNKWKIGGVPKEVQAKCVPSGGHGVSVLIGDLGRHPDMARRLFTRWII